MTKIKLTTFIKAPVERCFDLSRSIDVHVLSTKGTRERAIAGRTSGLIEKGETVTWEATHFGVKQNLTSRIAEMKPPYYFSDELVEGTFKSIYHEHHFENKDGGTVMTDDFSYQTPYGIIGKIFDVIVLKKYMTNFLAKRNEIVKKIAEGNEWIDILKNK